MVEHSAVNRRVASSNLARGAKFSFSSATCKTSFSRFMSGKRSVRQSVPINSPWVGSKLRAEDLALSFFSKDSHDRGENEDADGGQRHGRTIAGFLGVHSL